MIPINNSDTAWLIVADYNQENGKYHEELREDIISPNVDQWMFQPYGFPKHVGGEDNHSCRVGSSVDAEWQGFTIYGGDKVNGPIYISAYVGGHDNGFSTEW